MHALLSSIQKIQQLSEQLHQQLKLEKQALQHEQFQQLNQVVNEKQNIIDKLQALEQHCINNGPGNTGETSISIFIQQSGDKQLIENWDKARQHLKNCQQQNEINGRLLQRKTLLNQETLSILSGRPLQNQQTYNAQGEHDRGSSILNGINI